MPVKYIEVSAISDLFVAATRSYGDIAMVGTSTLTTTGVNLPQAFTDPITANQTFPGELGDAIGMAFKQTPAPTTIWGVRVDTAAPDWGAALDQVATLNVQIVALANQPLPAAGNAAVSKLSDHVSNTSSTGGDGKERIGVAMLAKGFADPTKALSGSLVNERMVYIAHQSDDDAAAAVAGVIAGYEPHISILLKPVSINMSTYFTDSQIAAFDSAGGINWLTSPVLIPGHGLYVGEGYTGNPSGGKKYIDIVRTLDDISFRIKATLIASRASASAGRLPLRAISMLSKARAAARGSGSAQARRTTRTTPSGSATSPS